jgi:PAS domain S-box-containing protein
MLVLQWDIMSGSNTHASDPTIQDRPLRVLLVEDSEFDAIFVVRYLESNGLPTSHRRICTREEMEDALSTLEWDLILCDYHLPNFSVASALDVLRQRRLDLPFIVVSGAIGEELAVDVMKAGAHDFIMKGRLTRLMPAIDREIREAKARRDSELALEKLACLAAIVDSADEAIVGQNNDGAIITWNAGAERLYGYSAAETIGRPASLLIPPALREEAANVLEKLQRGQFVQQLDTERLRKDGQPVAVCLTVSLIKNSQGRSIGASSLSYEITERKRMEDERTHLIAHLHEMLSKVKTLSGLLPICASCKKIRDDRGYWQQLEIFVRDHSGAEFSHSICPDCMKSLYPQFADQIGKRTEKS